jgi:hypothetical protein
MFYKKQKEFLKGKIGINELLVADEELGCIYNWIPVMI